MGRAVLPFSLLFVLCGCATPGSEPNEPPPASTCSAEEIIAGVGSCCPEGTIVAPDGSCLQPGIAADGCGDGFEHDGVGACTPVLPADPCVDGMIAIPGDAACREIAPCGTETYGTAPVDAATQHVDATYPSNDSDGSAGKPWSRRNRHRSRPR
jgi:hypothetical protein